ncbi:MAG: hypothetical protein ABFD89_18635 [Bryobacteraceae bacterium]
MSRNDPTELLVAVHFDRPDRPSMVVSIDGESKHARYIPRSLIQSFHLTGQTTQGTDRNGQTVRISLGNLVIPEWLATREELV